MKPAGFRRLPDLASAANADLFDHPVVVAPVPDQFDVAAVMPVVAAIFAVPVSAIVILNILVAIILIVVIAIAVVTANNDPTIGIVIRQISVVIVGLDGHACRLRRRSDRRCRGQCQQASQNQLFHLVLLRVRDMLTGGGTGRSA
jgi:hypothetical protein